MRKTFVVLAILLLAGCGGGGGGTSPAAPKAPPGTAPVSPASYGTPQFTILVPPRTRSASRSPQYVSSATASVWIKLTADSAGTDPATIAGNPAVTNIAPTCSASGCTVTVNGPPSPAGTDSFTIVTYDAANAGGNALNAIQANNVSVTAGQANQIPVTLGAIPATLAINTGTAGVLATVRRGLAPSVKASGFFAGTQGQTTTLTVTAQDAHGDTIPTGKSILYVDATGAPAGVTVTDTDDQPHGSCVIPSGTSTCTTGDPTAVQLNGPDDSAVFAYDGLAENPVTITASMAATSVNATFTPHLFSPAQNASQATPSGVASSSSPEIDLFATSGIGSTGTQYFTEPGWTNAPYNNPLTLSTGSCTSGSGLATDVSQFAVVSRGTNDTSNGTPVTATATGGPTPGSCTVIVADGLSGNPYDGSIALTVTYTTSGIQNSSRVRR